MKQDVKCAVPVVYEDNHLLVVIKPANLPVQADESGDMDLLTLLKAYIKEKYEKTGEVYLGLVHRLDRPVAGLVVFARTSKAAARLSQQLKTREMGRTYLLKVKGRTNDEGVLTDWLLKDPSANTTKVVPESTEGAKQAVLLYQTLGHTQEHSLVAASLKTGRSHQIRVQFSHMGNPIWGDARYGGGKPGEQIALYAWRLHLIHPTTKEPMQWEAPLPMFATAFGAVALKHEF